MRQRLLELRPALFRLRQIALRMGREGIAVGFQPKQIEPLARDHEEMGIARFAGENFLARDFGDFDD